MKRKQVKYSSFGQNVRMMKLRGDLHYFNIPLADKFSKKMVMYVNVLRI